MRGIWIAACLVGAIVSVGFVAATGLSIYLARNSPNEIPGLFVWMIIYGTVGGACIIGLFRPRAEIERAMQDEPVKPAEWIEEMRAQKERDDAP